MVGATSKDTIRMIRESEYSVDFKLQYDIREIRISHFCNVRTQQRKLVVYKRDGSFGFVLRKKDSIHFFEDYPVISNIKRGSHVHRHGLIHEGDRLLKVDDVNLSCLSLQDIASLLQEKSKAEFTYQYDVGMIDFSECGGKRDLDIELPNADLGIYLSADSEDSGHVYIEKIRLGSVAERCGLFKEGDIILSIDEIEVRYLTVAKASLLLRNCKKCRKISYRPRKRKKVSHLTETLINKSVFNGTGMDTTMRYDAQNYGQKLHITSEKQNDLSPSEQEIHLQKSRFSDQMKCINNIQNIVQVIKNLKQIQSQLRTEDRSTNAADFCIFCDKSQQSVKVCLLCLEEVNVSCSQSIDMLQNIVSHLATHSSGDSKNNFEINIRKKDIDDRRLTKHLTKELIHALEETLPSIFSKESHLREQFRAIAKRIMNTDSLCYTCNFEVKSIWITVKKLLLLLSVDYNRPDINIAINQLLYFLLEEEFSSDSSSASKRSDSCSFQSENPLYSSSEYFTGNSKLSDIDDYSTQSNLSSNSSELWIPDQDSSNANQTKIQKDYLKIIHIESFSSSEESDDENNLCEAEVNAKPLFVNDSFSLQASNLESSSTSFKVGDVAGNKRRETLASLTTACSSLDYRKKFTDCAKDGTDVPRKFSQSTKKRPVTNTTGMAQSVAGTTSDYARLLANQKPPLTGAHTSDFSDGSAPSSFTGSSRKGSQHNSRKICTGTTEVKLVNDGEGFGLGLALKFLSARSLAVPIVQSIQPRSPSHKSGVIQIQDRIIAINHRSTLGLSPRELQILKKRTLSQDSILLTVEFDIVDAELQVGTFDVVLDKTVKTGLIFEDMQRGYPMVVSGILKGSGAHRCGQLFPGDKIKFFRFIRNEEFDPVSCNYSKEESVLITVQRDKIEVSGVKEKPTKSSPCYFNPCFSHKDSVPRRGLAFVLKSSAMHVIEGTDALVFDQEVTLFRDPVSRDFGFLVGENPETKRAYVTDIRPDGPASKSGVIKKLDRIVEVNGISVDKNEENSALSLLLQSNHTVDLLIRRLYRENSSSV